MHPFPSISLITPLHPFQTLPSLFPFFYFFDPQARRGASDTIDNVKAKNQDKEISEARALR